jgi:hypothetical protein
MILNRKGNDFVRTKAANDARFRGSSLSSPSLELGTSAPTAESVDSAHSSVTLNSNGSVIDSHTASLHSYVHYGINIVMNKNDASVRRGAVVKSIALFSVYPWVESLKWALFAAVEELFAVSIT